MSTVDKILIGVTVGAVLGILYAPDKGSATRRKLARTGNDIRDKFYDLKDSISEKVDSFRDDADDISYQNMVSVETESTRPDTWQS
ncbi:MAG: YtxH domain-containing protein [Ferruginibacter sp.]